MDEKIEVSKAAIEEVLSILGGVAYDDEIPDYVISSISDARKKLENEINRVCS